MKKFKEVKSLLDDYNAWGSLNRSALSDTGSFYIERPEQLARINSFIESFMSRDFIDVRSALNHLRARLNISGIDFSLTPNTPVQEGSLEFPVTRYGGTFGTTPEHDLLTQGFYRDSGVPGMEFSLKTEITMSEGGSYTIKAKIIPSETTEEE